MTYTDSPAVQTLTFNSLTEKGALWIALWTAQLQIPKYMLMRNGPWYHNVPHQSDDRWPDKIGMYEIAESMLTAIRNPPALIFPDGNDLEMQSMRGCLTSPEPGRRLRSIRWHRDERARSPLGNRWKASAIQQKSIGRSGRRSADDIPLPERAGTYEYVLTVQAGLRSDGH